MLDDELTVLSRQHLVRQERTVRSPQGSRIVIDGVGEVVNLCSNDYLGLAEHSELRRAALHAVERFGVGSGASRLVSGTMELHAELEALIASFNGTDAAILFNSGYAANTGVIPAVVSDRDTIFSDRLNHASIIDGCRLSRARTVVYDHRDMDQLESLLRQEHSSRRKLIVSDGVFSMDGSLAPLPELVDLAERHNAVLMIDDAHGTGVLGKGGKGISEHFGISGRVTIQMGTLGKALGSFGAYVAGDRNLISYLRNRARSYMFSTSLPPAVCAASIAAIGLVEKEPWRRERLWHNRSILADGLIRMGLAAGSTESPILPVIIGSAERAVQAAETLLSEGVFAPAIRPPTVPEGTSRIRVTVMATHSELDMGRALAAFRKSLDLGVIEHHGGN